MDKLLYMDYKHYTNGSTGELINLSKNRIETVVNGIQYVFNIFNVIFDFIFLFGSIFIINKIIGIVFFVIFSIFTFVILNLNKLFEKYDKLFVKLDDELLNKINNIVLGFENILLFNKYKKEKEEYINNVKSINNLNIKLTLIDAIINISISIVYYVSLFSILFINNIFKLNLSVSSILIIVYIMDCLFNPIFVLSNLLDGIQKINISMKKINDFLNIKNNVVSGNIKINDFNKIEFKNVSFKYDDKYILKDINLVINKNEKNWYMWSIWTW
jgi:ATP-binding cassette subfamily B protein